jgi:hypothetical protein
VKCRPPSEDGKRPVETEDAMDISQDAKVVPWTAVISKSGDVVLYLYGHGSSEPSDAAIHVLESPPTVVSNVPAGRLVLEKDGKFIPLADGDNRLSARVSEMNSVVVVETKGGANLFTYVARVAPNPSAGMAP